MCTYYIHGRWCLALQFVNAVNFEKGIKHQSQFIWVFLQTAAQDANYKRIEILLVYCKKYEN